MELAKWNKEAFNVNGSEIQTLFFLLPSAITSPKLLLHLEPFVWYKPEMAHDNCNKRTK